jgi:uncharacterized membrane protein
MSKNRDLQIIGFFLFLLNIFILFEPLNTTIFRTLLGIPFILFVPGYSLIAALFPGKNDLDNIERMALSFGLSIAVVPLIGLGLNYTPFGIRLIPVLFGISIFILAMCFITYFRRRRLAETELFSVSFSNIIPKIKGALKTESGLDKILSIILVISIISSVLVLIYVLITPKQGEKYTEFYILGNEGKAANYPVNLEYENTGSLIAGIVNHEYIPINYTLQVLLENSTLNSKYIWLEHNSTWEERISFTPELKGNYLKLELLLYKENNLTEPYRDLHLWINVT